MSYQTAQTRTAIVRAGFTEQDEWRDALGNAEPLAVAVTAGPLDAPQHGPAGSTIDYCNHEGRSYGPGTTYYHREG